MALRSAHLPPHATSDAHLGGGTVTVRLSSPLTPYYRTVVPIVWFALIAMVISVIFWPWLRDGYWVGVVGCGVVALLSTGFVLSQYRGLRDVWLDADAVLIGSGTPARAVPLSRVTAVEAPFSSPAARIAWLHWREETGEQRRVRFIPAQKEAIEAIRRALAARAR